VSFASFFAQLLNGLAGASALFLVAAGLTLIFGVTRVVNFAHGSLYMLGAFIAYTIVSALPKGFIGFWGGVIFNDALLMDVAEPLEYNRVSALGYSVGYVGGGLLLVVNTASPRLIGSPFGTLAAGSKTGKRIASGATSSMRATWYGHCSGVMRAFSGCSHTT